MKRDPCIDISIISFKILDIHRHDISDEDGHVRYSRSMIDNTNRLPLTNQRRRQIIFGQISHATTRFRSRDRLSRNYCVPLSTIYFSIWVSIIPIKWYVARYYMYRVNTRNKLKLVDNYPYTWFNSNVM